MWLRLKNVEKKKKKLVLSSSLRTPDPSLLGDPGLLINLPRHWLAHCCLSGPPVLILSLSTSLSSSAYTRPSIPWLWASCLPLISPSSPTGQQPTRLMPRLPVVLLWHPNRQLGDWPHCPFLWNLTPLTMASSSLPWLPWPSSGWFAFHLTGHLSIASSTAPYTPRLPWALSWVPLHLPQPPDPFHSLKHHICGGYTQAPPLLRDQVVSWVSAMEHLPRTYHLPLMHYLLTEHLRSGE